MHGCGTNSKTGRTGGGQILNNNSYKDGSYTKETIEWRRKERAKIKEINDFLDFVIATNG